MNKIYISTLLMILAAISISAGFNNVASGGSCGYVDEEIFIRIASHENGRIELEPAYGDLITVSTSEFVSYLSASAPILPIRNDYYNLSVRRHTSGGCSPFAITNISKLEIPNLRLNPTEPQLYSGAFVLAEAKSCVIIQREKPCLEDLTIETSFDMAQRDILSHIMPRSIHHCSPASLKMVWTEIDPAPNEKRFISCVKNLEDEDVAIEFSIREKGDKRLLLRKIFKSL